MEKWIPLSAVVVSGVVGLVVWLVQKDRERKDQIRRRKQALYESLLTSVTELYSSNAAPLFVESQLAWLYASDNALELLNSLFVSIRDKKSESELQELLGKLLLEMRRDVFDKTRISEEWLKAQYVAVTPPREDVLKYLERRAPKLGD
jgi:hypothetical protein